MEDFLRVFPMLGSIGPQSSLNDLTQSFYRISMAMQGPSVYANAYFVKFGITPEYTSRNSSLAGRSK